MTNGFLHLKALCRVSRVSRVSRLWTAREKAHKAMLESLEGFVHWYHYPQTRDIDELRSDFRQAEWVVERAHRLEDEHE